MATSKMLRVLRRVQRCSQNFSQYRAACELDVYQRRIFSTRKKPVIGLESDDAQAKPKQRPKTVPVPKITLLSPDDSITVTELANAERLAKRRKLTLVKVNDLDSKTQRAVYKLVSDPSFFEEAEEVDVVADDAGKHEYKPHTKILYISSTIAQHDLLTKAKNVVKLLKKGYKVKVVIKLDNVKEDKVQSIIETTVKQDGNVQKMPSKKNTILLHITPLDKSDKNFVDNKEETNIPNTINPNSNI